MISARIPPLVAALCAASLAVLALVVLSVLDQNRIDDDAYIFVRYARNLLSHGAVAWNPGGLPTYGLTSLVYFAVVLVLHSLLSADPAIVLVVASLVCGAAFVAGLVRLVWRHVQARTRAERAVAVAGVLLGLVWAPGLAAHFVTGMDTMLALVWVAAYIGAAKFWQERPDARRTFLLGVAGGGACWVRPELLAYSGAVPLAAVLLAPSAVHARAARRALALTAGVAAACILAPWLYFGSPVPLPAYGKVLHGYGADMETVYSAFPGQQLLLFARDYAPFFLVAALGLPVFLRARGVRAAPIEVGIASGAFAILLFHRFFVLAIMGSHQRFYYPVLPALAFLAAQGGLALVSTRAASSLWARSAPLPGRAAALGGLACVLAAASLAPRAFGAVKALGAGPRFAHFAVLDNYANNWPSRLWIGLDRFSRLSDDLVIATTEVGYPGVLNPRKIIVDLSGLNDTEFARRGFSPRALFARYEPDLFLIPTRHYRELREALLGAPEFARGYQAFTPPRGGLGIALRRASKHYDAMRAALGG